MEGVGGLEFIPTVLSICIVLAVLLATLFALRWVSSLRFGGPGRDRRGSKLVDVVERHVIGRSGAIIVMRYGGREHVLGVTDASITHLAEGTIDLRVEEADAGTDGASPKTSRLERLREKTVRR